MAEPKTTIIPLNGKNYPTWKVQCKTALMKDSLWRIVSGTETLARDASADTRKKFDCSRPLVTLHARKSRGLCSGQEEAGGAIWSNKLQLRRKLFSLKLSEGESVH